VHGEIGFFTGDLEISTGQKRALSLPSPEKMAGMFNRWICLYLSVAFFLAMPVMSYKIIAMGIPKTALLIVIPSYLVLSGSFYYMFKSRSR
jgi:hypothetical protein